jgi:hypothetical protein
MRRTAIQAGAFVAALLVHGASRAADCSDILEAGIHNTYQTLDKSSLRTAYKNALCDQKSHLHSGSTNVSASGNYYYVISGNGDYSQSNVDQMASKYCQSGSSDLSDDDYHQLARMTVDQYAVDAWTKCMQSSGHGLFAKLDLNGNDVILTLEWQGFAGVNTATIAGKPYTDNLDCNAQLIFRDGFVLQTNTAVTQVCRRINANDVSTFNVNTSGGSQTLKLAAIPIAPAGPTPHRYQASAPFATPLDPVVVESVDAGPTRHLIVSFKAPAGPPAMPPPGVIPVPGSANAAWVPLPVPAPGPGATSSGAPAVIPVPSSGSASGTFNRILFKAGHTNPSGPPQYVPNGSFPEVSGTWRTGDDIQFSLDVPSNYFSDSGWFLTFCLRATSPICALGPNILQGSPLP